MIFSLLKYMQGFLQVKITGKSPERFLNLCVRRNVLILNLHPAEMGYTFCITLRGFRESKDLLKKTYTKVEILNKCGVPFWFYRYRKRKLFALGVVLVIFLLSRCSAYVWKIEVNGTSRLSEPMILTWLEAKQTGFGTKKANIDCEAVEAALRSQFEEIAWTSVKLEGTKLTVDLTERLEEETGAQLPSEGAWDLTAQEDAQIVSIYTRSGTPQVKKGDVVSKGAVLISGCLDILDDTGAVAKQNYIVADGDVTGRVYRSFASELIRNYHKKIYTGEQSTTYTLQLGNLKIPIFPKHTTYEMCETTVVEHQLEILPDFYLPVSLYKTTKKAYQYMDEIYTETQAEAILTEEWNQFLEKFTQKGIPIIVKNVKIETTEKKSMIRGTITADISIKKYAPARRSAVTTEE